jgi:hypothetical protein
MENSYQNAVDVMEQNRIKVNDQRLQCIEIYVINTSGIVINQVLSGIAGAVGGLNFTINSQKLALREMFQAMRMLNYTIRYSGFQHILSTNFTSEIGLEKPLGVDGLDVGFTQ